MTNVQLAGLKVHVVTSAVAVQGPIDSALVLLHGFGAPGTDLVSLADVLPVSPRTGLFFPEGPVDLGSQMGPAYAGGRAWWPIDMVRLQVAMMTGQLDSAAEGLQNGLEDARPQVTALLDALQSNFGVDSNRIVLGGFSQGAVACLDVALNDARPLAGLLLLSGTMVDAQRVSRLAPRRPGMRALLSHGQFDPMLPYTVTEKLRDRLAAAGWELTWVPFVGGHGIVASVTDAIAGVLPKWLT